MPPTSAWTDRDDKVGTVTSVFMVGSVQPLESLTPVITGGPRAPRCYPPSTHLAPPCLGPWTMLMRVPRLSGEIELCTGVAVGIGTIMLTAKNAGMIFGPLMPSTTDTPRSLR
jgi:ABC-2 type transport system permease protein